MNQIEESYNESLSLQIIQEIANETGTDPVELPPLYHTIDPTLIDALPERATLTFPYQGYTVAIDGDGAVTIRESEERHPRTDA